MPVGGRGLRDRDAVERTVAGMIVKDGMGRA
jgi:hypothetical protein